MTRMPWRWVLVLLGAALLPVPISGASASCAAASIDLVDSATRELRPGEPLTVRGDGFRLGCDDHGSVTVGAFGCSHEEREVETPMRDVDLVLRQGRNSWVLDTQDAGTAAENQLGNVTWHVELPLDLQPGRAVLVAHESGTQLRAGPRIAIEVSGGRLLR